MKKIILVLVVFVVVTGFAFAEVDILSFPPSVEGGNIMIDVGLGLRGLGYSGASWKIPPLFAQVEFALPVGVPISVGGMVAFYQYSYSTLDWKWTDMTFAVRGNWHWGLDIKWLDLYSGVSLGYTYSKWSGSSYWGYRGTDYSGFYYAVQGGAHFYFTKYLGAVAEVGYPYWIKAGLALKF
jgi:hypothetical protein